jgi:SNF2 family DNA or RNA helicase
LPSRARCTLGGNIRKALVVALLSVISVWDEEFVKFADFDYSLAVLSGTGVMKADTLRHMRNAPLQRQIQDAFVGIAFDDLR